MHKVDYRALQKMTGEFHSRQLDEVYSFENLLLEKANKYIFLDTKKRIKVMQSCPYLDLNPVRSILYFYL